MRPFTARGLASGGARRGWGISRLFLSRSGKSRGYPRRGAALPQSGGVRRRASRNRGYRLVRAVTAWRTADIAHDAIAHRPPRGVVIAPDGSRYRRDRDFAGQSFACRRRSRAALTAAPHLHNARPQRFFIGNGNAGRWLRPQAPGPGTPPLPFRSQAMRPPSPWRQGPAMKTAVVAVPNDREPPMQAMTIYQLLQLTKAEILAIREHLDRVLPTLPIDSAEHIAVVETLENIGHVLTRTELRCRRSQPRPLATRLSFTSVRRQNI
jgi:hypothetical protein